jgi:isoleucyl-tRNA synthetase
VALTAELQKAMLADYEKFEFHPAVARLLTFCSEDLGGFYLDILKDRLYTAGRDSKPRRAAQNALWHILQSLLKLIAPILSFTAEEAWKLAGSGDATIFVHTHHAPPAVAAAGALLDKWNGLRVVRAEVTKQLEAVRVSGKIGSSLQAEVEIQASGEKYALLASLGDDLRFVLIVSAAHVQRVGSAGEEKILVAASARQKCERCWHYRSDVGAAAEHPGLCGRCVSNLYGPGEPRTYA